METIRALQGPARPRAFGRTIGRLLAAVATALVITACSGSGADIDTNPAAEARAGDLEIQVRNNLVPAQTVTVTFHATAATERLLGSVQTDQVQTFSVRDDHAQPPFHLVAEGSGGLRVISRAIDAAGASRIEWTLETNLVQIDY